MTPLISAHGLTVKYDGCTILDKVNLDIYPHDFIGIIGPNGGGKTTLVKALLKSIPYSGSVDYAPEITADGYRSIGYLPQQNHFDRSFPISVLDVILSGLQARKGLWKHYRKADVQKAAALMQTTGLTAIARKPIGELSGGQMQRALLCRALISDPRVLILDEPANFVDNKFEKELYQILQQLNEHMAIVMVSHDIGTITSVVRTIVCVNRSVHRHNSNIITPEQLDNYNCPIQLISHGEIPHTVLKRHE